MLKIRRLILIAIAVTFIVTVFGLIYISYQRTTALNDLRFETDRTMRAIYLLNDNTYKLLYNCDYVHSTRADWHTSYRDATSQLTKLVSHEGLNYIDPVVAKQFSHITNLWNLTTSSYNNGNEKLLEYLKGDIRLPKKNSLSEMFYNLDKLTPVGNQKDEDSEYLSNYYFILKEAFVEIESANDNLIFFLLPTIEELSITLVSDVNNVIVLILFFSVIISILLVLFIILFFVIRQRILRTANIELEKTVKEKRLAIQNLLDYSGEGFISFGPDLIVDAEHSKESSEIFGKKISGNNLAELLYDDAQKRKDFAEAMRLVFDGNSMPEVVFNIIDKKIQFKDKTLELEFYHVDGSTIMCKFRDVTGNEFLQQRVEKENSIREMSLRAVMSKRDFLTLNLEAEDVFSDIYEKITIDEKTMKGVYEAEESENDKIIRKLHTFKANAGFLKMSETVESAHKLETALIDFSVLKDSSPVYPVFSELRKSFNDEKNSIIEVLGKEWLKGEDNVEIELDVIDKVKRFIKEKYPEEVEMTECIEQLSAVSLSNLFIRFSDILDDMALSNGKRIKITTKCDDIFVSTTLFRKLSDASFNVLQNIITHGIEFPGHREKIGKTFTGQVEISAIQEEDQVVLKFKDDGAGISVDKIKEYAIKSGRLEENVELAENDYMKMIFLPGFSTSDTVTAVSGRGYGLSSVKESIYELGGRIKVASSEGKGTMLTMIVPNSISSY